MAHLGLSMIRRTWRRSRRRTFWNRNHPVLLVTHDEDDGTWQALCGKTNDPKDGRVVGLGCLFERDPSIGQLADLPLGWRDSADSPWQRGPNPTPPE